MESVAVQINSDGSATNGVVEQHHRITGNVPHPRRSSRSTAESSIRRRTTANKCTDDASESTAGVSNGVNRMPVPMATTTTTLSKIGDVDREREIERRLAELGLTEYKKRHERSIAEALDAQIAAKDELAAVLRRCRRRQRKQTSDSDGERRPIDEIRNLVQQKIIRDAWGDKVAYDIRIFMGCFTKNVTYQSIGNVVDVQGMTADDDADSGSVKLTKDITVELPKSADANRVTVTYAGGVVKIFAPVGRSSRRHTTTNRTVDGQDEIRPRPQFSSVSPLYSLQQKLLVKDESVMSN